VNREAPGFSDGPRPQAAPGPDFPPEADPRGINSDDPSTKAIASYIAGKYQTELRRVLALFLDIVFIHMAAAILSFPFLMLAQLFGLGYIDSKLTLAPFYIVLATWMYGKTLGKRICGLEVRPWPDVIPDLPSPARITLGASMVREIVPILLALASMILWRMPEDNGRGLPFITLGLGLVIATGSTFWILLEIVTMLMNPERRAFQDKIAGTVVVRAFAATR
jgi:uncharacterized RDD family membrane protein YckC